MTTQREHRRGVGSSQIRSEQERSKARSRGSLRRATRPLILLVDALMFVGSVLKAFIR